MEHRAACLDIRVMHLWCAGNGTVLTWGRGEDGQLGHGDSNERDVPEAVASLHDKAISSVHCGAEYTVALSSSQSHVYSWGWCVNLTALNTCHHAQPLGVILGGSVTAPATTRLSLRLLPTWCLATSPQSHAATHTRLPSPTTDSYGALAATKTANWALAHETTHSAHSE